MRYRDLLESKLPSVVYHGTSEDAWGSIRKTDTMMAMNDGDAISFTGSHSVAEEFARQSAKADDCEKGVVIYFDTAKLVSRYNLVRFHDENLDGNYRFFGSEDEYRVEQAPIKNITDCVVGTSPVWAESSPELHDHKSDSEIIADAVGEIRDQCAPNFAGKCEGAIGDLSEIFTTNYIEHQVIEGRYLKPMMYDGKEHPFTPHWWIEYGNYIIDPTREQFGKGNLIINKNSDDAKLYAYGGVGQV